MSPDLAELREFHRFLGEKLSDGNVDWSPEEAVDEWRRARPDEQGQAEELTAIAQALADLANGDGGIPYEEFDRDFRKRHDLPGKP